MKKIHVWCTRFSQGESTIYVEDKETAESFGEYLHVQNEPISAKEVFEATGRVKGSFRGICSCVREIKEWEEEYRKENLKDYRSYWGKKSEF